MEKNLEDDLIELSITNLIQCLESSNKKELFINEISSDKYSKIVSLMREESTVIQMRDFHNWIKLVLISNITSTIKNKRIALSKKIRTTFSW